MQVGDDLTVWLGDGGDGAYKLQYLLAVSQAADRRKARRIGRPELFLRGAGGVSPIDIKLRKIRKVSIDLSAAFGDNKIKAK